MIQALKKAAYAHGYLFITAAWLYTISFVFTNYWSYSSSPKNVEKTLQKYLTKNENDLNRFIADTNLINAVIAPGNEKAKDELADQNAGIFIYSINDFNNFREIYWNTNTMAPAALDLKNPDNNYFVNYENGSFELVRRTISFNKNKYLIVGLIPVRWVYFVNNKYLSNGFAGFPEIEKRYRITSGANGIPVLNSEKQTIFRIEKKPGIFFDQPDFYSIILRVLAILCLLFFINTLAIDLANDVGFFKALVFLCSIILVFRFLTYEFPFPFDFRRLELFYGGIYASSSVNPSLGDLLVNVILLFWIISFIKFNYKKIIPGSVNFSKQQKRITAIAGLIFFAGISLEAAGIIASLVKDSTLSFDVTDFFGLNIYIFVCLVIIAFIILSFFYLSHLLLPSYENSGLGIYLQMIIVAAGGLSILSVSFGGSSIQFKIITLAWLLFYMLLLRLRRADKAVRILNSSFL